jgi:DNA-binding response OmpR family regulator
MTAFSKNILLIMDDRKELEFFKAHLSEDGFNVYTAENIKEASTFFTTFLPDLMVINTLESSSPINLQNHRITLSSLNDVPVLSSVNLPDSLDQGNKKYFISKPLRPKLLLSLIRSLANHEEDSWLPYFR